jgi:creatinine amidohydrolase
MLWYEQNWPTISALDMQIPVVLPLGSMEQHGHHLPLFVDTMQVTKIAERVEKAMGNKVLLAPTLWLGCSEHHLDFPGTVSVPASMYSQMIKSMARCVLKAGFRKIFFLNGHGGNQVPGAQALTEYVGESDEADDAYLVFASWWHVGQQAIEPKKHGLTTPFISHACEYETSMMLAIRPDLVNVSAIVDAKPAMDNAWWNSEYGGRVQVFRRFARLTAAGSMGSAKAATAEKGQAMIEAVVGDVVAFLNELATWPAMPKIGPR